MYARIISVVVITILCYTTKAISEDLNNVAVNSENERAYSDKADDLLVCFDKNLLSVRANDVSIEDIMQEVVRISGVKGWVFDGGKEKITIEFRDIPLQMGIAKILKNRNYGFFYNQGDSGGALHLVETEQSLPTGPSGPVDNEHRGHFNSAESVSKSMRNASKNNVHARLNKRKYSEQNTFGLANVTSHENNQKIEEIKNLLTGIDLSGITNALSQSTDTPVQGVTPAGAEDFIEALNNISSAEGVQSALSNGETGQAFIENLKSSIMDELKKFMSINVTK
ncbi:hypothetical protein SCALIN_C11_0015 [Candidatus Scalindua japonica]|uniref:Uncharacterized protein n=1 Tax=Candidatus Scalindua japonica TaxID=1284222 RepID=A0A286TWZ8_9BACT|nr:hypothetical protein [Candidatus Scalindua japonica]GAX60404.1 hypothetical protein SCALIN_C11_0015 [Candidatus Scalindua japonica]